MSLNLKRIKFNLEIVFYLAVIALECYAIYELLNYIF